MTAEIVLVRHGETAWSRSGQHTSRTDVPLTDIGREQASGLAHALARWSFTTVWTSPMRRARETCDLAGLGGRAVVDDDLREWDYGLDEGRTTAEIRAERPGWTVFRDGPAGGESADDVQARADRVLERVRASLDAGNVAVFGHGHMLRVIGARWVGLPARAGRLLALDTATRSVLGFEREQPVVRAWNLPRGDGPRS